MINTSNCDREGVRASPTSYQGAAPVAGDAGSTDCRCPGLAALERMCRTPQLSWWAVALGWWRCSHPKADPIS